MAKKRYTDFQEWVEASELSEEDLQHIQHKLGKRAVIWFFLSFTILLLPFFVETWAWYKRIKQRTFQPKAGLLFSLCALIMFLFMGATLIAVGLMLFGQAPVQIIPLIMTLIIWGSWFIVRWTGFGTGLKKKL
ncbi:MAG: hypothetical protein K2K63_15330 [Acetatifactor sp.]|nr:hypothetical protein [Acetatifactor sp.]